MANRGILARLRSIGGHCGSRRRWPIAYTGEPSDSENLLSMAIGLHPLQLKGQTSRVYGCLCVGACVVRGHAYAPMPMRICMRMYTCPYVYANTRVTRACALCVRVYTQASAGGTGEFNARANYDT